MTLLVTFALTAALALAIGLAAVALARRSPPSHRPADGEASVTGTCGDTMTLQLKVHDGRIKRTTFKTKGCAYSFSCLQAAADAAGGRTLLEVLDIDSDFIVRKVGHIPQDHRHCATLAVQTLHTAVDCYMQRKLSSPAETGDTARLT